MALDPSTRLSTILYTATGVGVFGGVGDPNGVQKGGYGSIYSDFSNGDVYVKTTAFETLTGWSLLGGGGGSGTVTNFSAGNLSPLFTSSVLDPTTTPSLSFSLDVQSANRIFAGPATGVPATPTFRALTSADLSLAAAPPANGIQYNDGTNAFTATNGFKFDPASNTLQLGESGVLKGTAQWFAALGAGSVKLTVNNPGGNYVYIFKDALPANNDLAQFSVSGSNVTISSIAASALGFPTINPTDGVIPYRSSSSAFSDSPLFRNSSTLIGISGNGVNDPALKKGTGNSVLDIRTGTDSAFGGLQCVFLEVFNGANGKAALDATGSATYGLLIASDAAIRFSSSTSNPYTGNDSGIARRQAGYVRTTNGSTGIGGLLVGNSTATPIGQTHLINGAVGVEPLYLEAIASTSVPTIRGVQSSIQSFAFMPSGKLIGGCNIPTANQQFSALGNAKSDVSTIGNVGGGNDNLLSFSIGANVLANTGDYAEFDAFGDFAANANNKTLQIVYGATTIFNTGAVAFNGSNWRINAKILRTGASAGKSIVTFWSNDATTPFLQEIFITTEDFTAAKTVQFKGESAASATDDIRQLHLESKLTVALTS